MMGFPGRSVGKNLPANAGDTGGVSSISGFGRSPGEGNGNPLQYSCLENSMNRGAWRATVHGVAESQTPLSTNITETKCLCVLFFASNFPGVLELLGTVQI